MDNSLAYAYLKVSSNGQGEVALKHTWLSNDEIFAEQENRLLGLVVPRKSSRRPASPQHSAT